MPNGDPRDGFFYPTVKLMIDPYIYAGSRNQASFEGTGDSGQITTMPSRTLRKDRQQLMKPNTERDQQKKRMEERRDDQHLKEKMAILNIHKTNNNNKNRRRIEKE